MSTLYIQEFSNISSVGGGGQGINKVNVGSLPNVLAFNHISLTSSSAYSAPFSSTTQYIRICADTDCFIAFSQGTPTATTASITSLYVPAKVPEYLAVQPNGWLTAIL